MTSLLASVVQRRPLDAPDGKSGSRLESVVLANGDRLVVKHVVPAGDWIMRGTHDEGRAAALWLDGVLDRVPAVIDHTVLGAEATEHGWLLVMRDVAETFVPEGVTVSRADSRRILDAAAALHLAFRGQWEDGGCPLADRYAFLSPTVPHREPSAGVPALIGRGWERFADVVPSPVAEAVAAIHADPTLLASALDAFEATLIHGDLKFGNIGLTTDRVVLVDWGPQCGMAPPAVEFAWYLALNATRLDATRDEVLDDVRAASGPFHDDAALRLALLGGLVQLGWDKALGSCDHPDPAVRERETADLGWWVGRAQEALEHWAPA
jgi:hypothetical protein